MTNEELISSLFEIIKSIGYEAGFKVAYPGKKFTPPDSGRWLEMSIAINDLQPDITGNHIARRGIFQINACDRPDKNPIGLYEVADYIASVIAKGSSNDFFTITQNPAVGSLIELDDRVILPITITYSE